MLDLVVNHYYSIFLFLINGGSEVCAWETQTIISLLSTGAEITPLHLCFFCELQD